MSLTTLPVSVTDLENLQLGILRVSIPTEATAEAALINAGATTVNAYANTLLNETARASEIAVGVVSESTNVTPTAAQLNNLVLTFAPPQIANAIAHGFNPVIYVAETMGLGLPHRGPHSHG